MNETIKSIDGISAFVASLCEWADASPLIASERSAKEKWGSAQRKTQQAADDLKAFDAEMQRVDREREEQILAAARAATGGGNGKTT